MKVPGIKQPVPKWMVGVGLGGVGVAIILYYRSKKAASTATATAPTSTDQYPPDGTVGNPSDPYSTDPATGQTYGNEAAGSGGTFGAFGGLGGGSGTGWDPNTGLYTDPNGNTCTNPDGNGFCPGTGSGGPPFSTNQAWAAFAEQQLANDSSVDPGALAEALGLYLDGQPVTAAQKTLIFQAQGVAGPVPVAGPNGFPPNIQTSGQGGQDATNPVTGLKQTGQEGFTGADISWNKSTNATSYTVTSDKGTVSTSGTTARIHDIAPKNSQATVSVLANPAAAGAVPAKIVVKVKGEKDAHIVGPPKPKH